MIEAQSFVHKYGLLACTQCGKCTGGCPMSLKTHFNIRRLLYEAIIGNGPDLYGREELWDCTTCSTCAVRCPKGLNPVEVIIGMRGLLVEDGRIPPTVRDPLKSVFMQGNPFIMAREQRSEWTNGLNVKSVSEGAEVLYFVGCAAAYEPRIQKVARALVQGFEKAGVNFGTLGNEEICCGSEVRRIGESGLFEYLVEENVALFKEYPVECIVTTSPHCYNTFKNEYQIAGLEVQHYTQFVAQLIEQGKLSFSKEVRKVVTYQDPCFLGKRNGVFEEPRKILRSIPGLQLVEMDRSRERSLCCESGGGRMWIEGTNPGERLAHMRIKEAVDLGAQVLATACPFCHLTLEDAAKVTDYEDVIQVLDIMELVIEAI
ncbi:MAG: (Fe-S)-binding protein [Anaerolineae bacterium]